MGKSKRFISKGEGQHFYLLHRSQTDEAYAQEQRPSNFVLVAAQDNGNQIRKQQRDLESTAKELEFKGLRDHITPLGFKDDGYDYSQHLKEMGGGHFIGRDGKVGAIDYGKELELPADALPSGAEMDRHLEAVTISHEYMDPDLRAALFDEADEEGEFEELQDDFVLQAMTEPEEPDFDFDAHIAELIARSERETRSMVKPRGWENDQELLKKGKMKRRPKNDDDEYDDDDEDDEFDLEDFDEDDEYDEDDDDDDDDGLRGHRTIRLKGRKEGEDTGAAGGVDDDDFDRFLEEEYDDGKLGYISDAEEEEIQGVIDMEGNELFNQAIEEYIQEKKDSILATGVTVVKGARALPDDIPSEEVDVKKEATEQKLRQIEGQIVLEEIQTQGVDPDIPTCQEYLREERPREEWDCETIISTYSTLDNNPTVIKSSSKYKPYKSRHQRAAEKEAAIAAMGSPVFQNPSDAENPALSSYTVSGYRASLGGAQIQLAPQGSSSVSKIVLKGKLGLPEGFGPGARRSRNKDDDDQSSVKSGSGSVTRTGASTGAGVSGATSAMSKLSVSGTGAGAGAGDAAGAVKVLRKGSVRKTTLRPVREGNEDDEDDNENHDHLEGREEGEDNEDDEDDEDYSDDDENDTVMTTASMIRLRGETPEQRKARKALAKEEKRLKRNMKKQLKEAYKEETKKQITATGKQQSLNNTSVFKYSV